MLNFFYRLDIISSLGAFEGDHLHNGDLCIFCLTTCSRRGQQLVYLKYLAEQFERWNISSGAKTQKKVDTSVESCRVHTPPNRWK